MGQLKCADPTSDTVVPQNVQTQLTLKLGMSYSENRTYLGPATL